MHLVYYATEEQKYFKGNGIVWQQVDGMPMGSPVPSILAQIHIQEKE